MPRNSDKEIGNETKNPSLMRPRNDQGERVLGAHQKRELLLVKQGQGQETTRTGKGKDVLNSKSKHSKCKRRHRDSSSSSESCSIS